MDVEDAIIEICSCNPCSINDIVRILNDTYNIRILRQAVSKKARSLSDHDIIRKETIINSKGRRTYIYSKQ